MINHIDKETILETTWNLCKIFDTTQRRHDHTILTNFISISLELRWGIETENYWREEWQKEVGLFCNKYGYS